MDDVVKTDLDLTGPDVADGPAPEPFFREIEKPAHITTSGFFDPANPHDPEATVPIILKRVENNGDERFRLQAPIGYWDKHVGGIIVPHDLTHFLTDLTSVPQLLTWLIPRTGTHLPAALIHDALIPETDGRQTYVASQEIDAVDADRIFRDAMKDLGTTLVTRWMLWTAVGASTKVTTTMADEPPPTQPSNLGRRARRYASAHKLWGRFVILMTLATIVILGTIATLELVDCWNVIPQMADQSTLVELAVGFAAAVITPAFISLFWGPQWKAGLIAGVVVALLLHIMAALVVVFGVFKTADCLSAREYARAGLWFTSSMVVTGIVGATITFVCG